MKIIMWSSYFLLLGLQLGCSEQHSKSAQDQAESEQQALEKTSLDKKFKTWKATQDQTILTEYYQFMSQYMKHQPSMMELMTNRNFMSDQCQVYRFAIPPKKYWNNIVRSIQLVEKLNTASYFKRYTITATYRSPELNQCVHGAAKSKHLYHYAIDFHVLDPKETIEKDRELLVKKLCEFWKIEGKSFKMGLGVYGNNRYHIDTQGHRTWGKDYKSSSSPCLQP